jgi:tape measure domain-containing protein
MATERIQIVVSESGTRTVKRNIEDIGTAGKSAAEGANLLKSALAGIGVALGISELLEWVNTIQKARNNVALATGSALQANAAFGQLKETAAKNGASLNSMTDIFKETSDAFDEFGFSIQDNLNVTKALSNGVRAMGGDFEENAGKLKFMFRAFNDGVIGGLEFARVIRSMPELADALANHFNTTRGGLQKLIATGKITATQLANAFRSADFAKELEDKVAKLPLTVGQHFQVLKDKVADAFTSLATGSAISNALGGAFKFLGDHADALARIIAALAVAIGVTLAAEALPALAAALLNPVLLVAAAVAGLVLFSDKIKVTKDGITTLADVSGVVWGDIKSGVSDLVASFKSSASGATTPWIKAFSDIDFSFKGIVRSASIGAAGITGYFVGGVKAIIAVWKDLPAALGDIIIQAANKVIKGVEDMVNGAIDALNHLPLTNIAHAQLGQLDNAFAGSAKKVGDTAGEIINTTVGNYVRGTGSYIDSVFNRAEAAARDRLKKAQEEADLSQRHKPAPPTTPIQHGPTFDQELQKLKDRAAALELNARDGEVLFAKLRIEETLKRKLTTTEAGLVAVTARHIQALQDERDVYEEIRGPQETAGFQLQALDRLLAKGKISVAEYAVEWRKLREDQLSTAKDFASGYELWTLRAKDTLTDLATATGQVMDDIKGDVNGATVKIAALNKLFADGKVTVDQYGEEWRKLRLQQLENMHDISSGAERAALDIQEKFGNAADAIHDALVNAFSSAEDALVSLIDTGKVDIQSLAASIQADFTKAAVRATITAPLANAVGDSAGPLGKFFGDAFGQAPKGTADDPIHVTMAAGAAGLLGGVGGATGADPAKAIGDALNTGGAQAGASIQGGMQQGSTGFLSGMGDLFTKLISSLGDVLSQIGSGVGSLFSSGAGAAGSGLESILPAFAGGGSFTVGGEAGTDSNTVAFRATRGEKVTVETPSQQAKRTAQVKEQRNTVVFHVHGVTDMDSFRRSENQLYERAHRKLARAQARNNQ